MPASNQVLIDTSAWIHALRRDGDPTVRSEVKAVTAEGRAVFCDMVLLELWNGARGSAEAKILEQLENNIETVSTTSSVWRTAMAMARTCRRKGVIVPATDLLIATCAEEHELSLLHRDRHFDLIANLTLDDRTSP